MDKPAGAMFPLRYLDPSPSTTFEHTFAWRDWRCRRRSFRKCQLRFFPIALGTPEAAHFFLNQQGQVVRMSNGVQLVTAENYLSFLETHFERLRTGVYPVKTDVARNLRYISRFPTQDPCGSDVTTHGIRIRANALHVPEQSEQKRICFTYSVRISWAGDETDQNRYQLTTRHWRIRDGNGDEQRVDGPGLIGMYPVMYAGCEEFEYASCTFQPTTSGSVMSGSFDFQVGDTEEEISCVVGAFQLDINRTYN